MHILITTKPGKKYASIRNPRVYEALRKKGYSKRRAAMISNAMVSEKTMTPSEVGRTAALARWRGHTKKPTQPGKGRRPAKTEVERQQAQQARRAEREQERQAERTAKRADVFRKMNIAPDGQAALEALRRGEQPDAAAVARGGFVDAGLVERAADGSYRMTPAGRALMASAESGDAGRAGDTISSSRDRLSVRRARQAEQATRRQAKQPTAGGGKKKAPPKPDRPSEVQLRRIRKARERIAEAVRRARERTKATTPTRTTDAGHTGVVVALYPDQAAAKAIAAAGGVTEPLEQLHLTLCFLGDSTEQPLATNKEKVIQAVAEWAQQHGQPLNGEVNGLGRFFQSESDNTNAVYVAPDVPGLPELRQSLVQAIEASGFDYSHDHGFTPHITVAYVPEDAPTPSIRVETSISFDRAILAWGDEQYEFGLGLARQTTKAQTAEDRAMFAKMGGGGKGGSGGGGSALWPRGEGGKRTPSKADAQRAFRTWKRRSDARQDAQSRAIKLDAQASQARRSGDKARADRLQRQSDRARAEARTLDTHKRNLSNLEAIERAGYRLNANSSGIVPLRPSQAPRPRSKSFAVFKDHTGQHRWLSHTTTAYRDRDGEILSTRGLEANAARMTATKQYGPLRYWHIGQADPENAGAPWGPGLDIGDCDFSMLIGRTLVESGTFRTVQIAEKMAAQADSHEMSPGFLHDDTQPDPHKVFDEFFIFERSVVPTDHARASNLFTSFRVKEQRMDPKEFEKRLKVAQEKLGLSDAQTDSERAALLTTDKVAAAHHVAYKSSDADEMPPIFLHPTTHEPGVILDGHFVALKAFDDMADEDGEAEIEVEEAAAAPPAAPDMQAIATAVAQAVVAELLPHLNISDKIGELKSLMGGYTKTKDDAQAQVEAARAQQVTDLQAKIAEQQQLATELQTKLKELTEDQPAAQTPPTSADGDVVAALKSAGPAQSQPQAGSWDSIFEHVATGGAPAAFVQWQAQQQQTPPSQS